MLDICICIPLLVVVNKPIIIIIIMYVCVYLFCRKYYSGVLPSLYRTAEDLDMLPNFQLAHTQTATKHFTAIFMMFQVCMAYLFIYLSFLYILLTLEALDGQPLPVSSAGFTFFIVTPRFSSFSLLLKERERLCVCVCVCVCVCSRE